MLVMNSIQIADETFIAADPVAVGEAVADKANWSRWWPDLRLSVVEDLSLIHISEPTRQVR